MDVAVSMRPSERHSRQLQVFASRGHCSPTSYRDAQYSLPSEAFLFLFFLFFFFASFFFLSLSPLAVVLHRSQTEHSADLVIVALTFKMCFYNIYSCGA